MYLECTKFCYYIKDYALNKEHSWGKNDKLG